MTITDDDLSSMY